MKDDHLAHVRIETIFEIWKMKAFQVSWLLATTIQYFHLSRSLPSGHYLATVSGPVVSVDVNVTVMLCHIAM